MIQSDTRDRPCGFRLVREDLTEALMSAVGHEQTSAARAYPSNDVALVLRRCSLMSAGLAVSRQDASIYPRRYAETIQRYATGPRRSTVRAVVP